MSPLGLVASYLIYADVRLHIPMTHHIPKGTGDGLFAHVVTGNKRTARLVEKALGGAGLPTAAINLVPVPSDLGLYDDLVRVTLMTHR